MIYTYYLKVIIFIVNFVLIFYKNKTKNKNRERKKNSLHNMGRSQFFMLQNFVILWLLGSTLKESEHLSPITCT